MPLISSTLDLEHLGNTGDNLCWAEVSHVVSKYFQRDPEDYGDFVARILGAPCARGEICDGKANVLAALEAKSIGTVPVANKDFWRKLEENFSREYPVPWLLVAGEPGGETQHAMIISGMLIGGEERGVVVQDPSDGDYLRLFLEEDFNRNLAGHFHPFEPRPRNFNPQLKRGRILTNWGDGSLTERRLSAVQSPTLQRIRGWSRHCPRAASTAWVARSQPKHRAK